MELPKAIHELEYNHGSIYGPEEAAAVARVMAAGAASCGPQVKQFEERFAEYCGTRYGLTVCNATAGLELAMIALDVGPGDEVITSPLSWISTANAIAARGATVVFADVDERTLNLDPTCVAQRMTSHTKAILPVHLFGHPCDMDALAEIARLAGAAIVEDCADTPGGLYRGRKTGGLGQIGVFSFHQQKNMVTLGEGGMVTTDDPALFERLLSYRSLCCMSYDPKGKYLPIDEQTRPMGKRYWMLDFADVGYNFRMTEVQAAVGLVQLGRLDGLNTRRREIADRYTRGLADVRGLTLPCVAADVEHTFHVYCVLLDDAFPLSKEDFMWELLTRYRIKAWSHYMPMHLTTAYRNLGHAEGECPRAEALFQRYVSLPIHPRLTDEAIEYLITSIRALGGGA